MGVALAFGLTVTMSAQQTPPPRQPDGTSDTVDEPDSQLRSWNLLATNDGVQSTGSGHPADATPTIMSQLDTKGVTWGAYASGAPFEGSLTWTATHAGVHNFAAFKTALADGTLPSVAFVDGGSDEHPTQDVQVGEAWTRDVYQAVIASPLWSSTAMIWT